MDYVHDYIKSGYKVVKQKPDRTVLKSSNSILFVNSNGTVEGFFEKNVLTEGKISLKSIRHGLQGIVIFGLVLTYFTTDITIVDGHSMEPALKNHQLIIKAKSISNVEKVKFGKNSIVKLISPEGDQVIKRIVAIGGDTIEYKGAHVFINGKDIGESAAQNLRQLNLSVKMKKIAPDVKFTLKNNEYYVVGDNQDYSIDSREYGPINGVNLVSVVEK